MTKGFTDHTPVDQQVQTDRIRKINLLHTSLEIRDTFSIAMFQYKVLHLAIFQNNLKLKSALCFILFECNLIKIFVQNVVIKNVFLISSAVCQKLNVHSSYFLMHFSEV